MGNMILNVFLNNNVSLKINPLKVHMQMSSMISLWENLFVAEEKQIKFSREDGKEAHKIIIQNEGKKNSRVVLILINTFYISAKIH